MNRDDQLEAHFQKNEKAIQELSIRIEALNNDIDELLSELQVTPSQLTAFIESKDNFSKENWSTLQAQRKALDEKLLRELLNIKNPKKAKESFKQLNVQPHWLFVR
jgi:hypothetical protein